MQMPYYPQGMMPPMPMPYPPYYPNYHNYPAPMMSGSMPQSFMNSALYNSGPGAGSIAAALNLPGTQGGMSDENIAGQLGNSIQLPIYLKNTDMPAGLLSAKAVQPKSPQIGAAISPQISNDPERTAPVPVLY